MKILPKLSACLILSFSLTSCGLELAIKFPDLCLGQGLNINTLDSDLATATLEDAAFFWNDAADYYVITVNPLLESDIVIQYVNEIDQERYPGAWGLAYAYWSDQGAFEFCYIEILRGKASVGLVAHEIGHCLGFGHDSAEEYPRSIMNNPLEHNYRAYPHHWQKLQDCEITKN